MNLNKKIGMLLDNGFKPEFISSLTESKINFLFEKMSKRKETKEQAASTNVQKVTIPATTAYKIPAGGEVDINNVKVTNQGGVATVTPTSGKPVTETEEIDEKFESKAQQGLFWARCNKCKDDDCKWCKMAKEFSKSTSKKQYEKMPEKKHPEKTVKYKKKKTNEEFTMANYFDKLSSVYANNAMGKTIGNLTKENIENIIEKNLKPTMKKRDLLKLIESEIKHKKGLNEDFYMGDMDEEFDFMSDTETAPVRIKPKRETEPKREWEPDFDEPMFPDEDTESEPQARGRMGRLRMGGIDAPTIEPGIREPKIKPKEPDTTPEWTPDEDEPIIPSPDVNPEPQAKRKKDFLNRFKHDFDRKMSRMDESTYKPINYRKF
jgi:hypothetical protein